VSDTSACLAIDIGGTKMAVATVTRSGEILESDRSPTPADADAEALFTVLARLVEAVRSATPAQLDRCGVGSGGPMTAGGERVSPINIPAWRDFPLRHRLGELTGLPIVVDNDAKALALAEGWKGSAQGMTDYISMVVSTGVGGGIVSGGRLVDGATGNAGHIGHVTVEPDGHLCGCGARGCLEAEASGTAIARITGAPPAEAGPEVVERTGRLVGRAVASVANLLDLNLAVVGGSVALGYGEAFFGAAQAELGERARLSYSREARVVPTGLGPTGGLIGAARLAYVRPA
jgi:glucokinase